MSATNWTYTFTDFRLPPPGGTEPHGLTSGALRLNRRWTLEFRKFRQTETRSGDIAQSTLTATPRPEGGCWVVVVDDATGQPECAFVLPNTSAEVFTDDLARLRERLGSRRQRQTA